MTNKNDDRNTNLTGADLGNLTIEEIDVIRAMRKGRDIMTAMRDPFAATVEAHARGPLPFEPAAPDALTGLLPRRDDYAWTVPDVTPALVEAVATKIAAKVCGDLVYEDYVRVPEDDDLDYVAGLIARVVAAGVQRFIVEANGVPGRAG